jgi:hypothetical protein
MRTAQHSTSAQGSTGKWWCQYRASNHWRQGQLKYIRMYEVKCMGLRACSWPRGGCLMVVQTLQFYEYVICYELRASMQNLQVVLIAASLSGQNSCQRVQV